MTPAQLRARIQAADAGLAERFWGGELIDTLLADRAGVFDDLIRELWTAAMPADAREQMAIYAVGGYGRGELHPGSDIDLLVLVRRPGHELDVEGDVVGHLQPVQLGHGADLLGERRARQGRGREPGREGLALPPPAG